MTLQDSGNMALAPCAKVQQMSSWALQSQQRSFISEPFLLIDQFTICTPSLCITSITAEVLFSQLTLVSLVCGIIPGRQ